MNAERVTLEQLQELSPDEQHSMLFFMLGYGSKSPKFQEVLSAAYDEAMRARVRRAAREAVRDMSTDEWFGGKASDD